MTTQANIPAKWYVPFANGDGSRVELPVTTADPTRASQTLGFPPLTMQPPESGGVPPQGEDFNGGMNQIARVAWWVLNGGGWPYDASFATQANIQGYPNGATLQAADFRGDWISTTDGNQNNPDTTGTGWVPGFQYGVTALTSLTGGTVTPTPAQAAKGIITLSGVLTGALTIVLPAWAKHWTITNSTSGAFVTIVKTAAGSGVVVPQGVATPVWGDGTNILAIGYGASVGAARTARNLVGANNSGTPTTQFDVSADAVTVVNPTSLAGVTLVNTGTLTNNISTAGPAANGRDQAGAFSASSWIYLYIIYNGTTTATLSSTVAPPTGPTLPTGYTHWYFAAALRLNGSTQIVPCKLRGNWVTYNTGQTSVSAGTATTATSVSVSAIVPPNALEYRLNIAQMAYTGNGTGNGAISTFVQVSSAEVTFSQSFALVATANGAQFAPGGTPTVPNVNQTYFYYTSLTTGTNPSVSHAIFAYSVPNGA